MLALKSNPSKSKDVSVRYLSCFMSSVVRHRHRSDLITVKHINNCCSCLESNTASVVNRLLKVEHMVTDDIASNDMNDRNKTLKGEIQFIHI